MQAGAILMLKDLLNLMDVWPILEKWLAFFVFLPSISLKGGLGRT